MKYTNKWILALLPATLLASCAEDVFEPYAVDAPASIAELQYLKEYNVLKEYAGTGIKIGADVNVDTYTQQGALFGLAKTNFHEVSGGTSFMHKVLARDDGSVNLGAIVDFTAAAETAGQSVFGSALVSNINQNGKYFKNLLADKVDPNYVPQKVEVKKHDDTKCIRVQASKMASQAWDNQFWIIANADFKPGDSYEVSMTIRADFETPGISTQIHDGPGGYQHYAAFGNPVFTTEWKEYTASGNFASEFQSGGTKGNCIAFNLNDFADANNYYFKDISLKINGTETVINGDLKTDDVSSFVSKELGTGNITPSVIVDGYDYIALDYVPMEVEVNYNKPVIVVHSQDMVQFNYETQFWISTSQDFTPGDSYELTMKVRADKPAEASTQVHDGPGGYQHWAAVGNVKFTKEWEDFEAKGTIPASWNMGGTKANAIALNLNDLAEANTYYFGYISLKINGKEMVTNPTLTGSDNSSFFTKEAADGITKNSEILPGVTYIWEKDTPGIPLTEEERTEAVTKALESYIQTIMKTSEGKIKSWDVIGDVLSADGSAFREASDEKTEFNWSADLGKEEFARLAVKYARKYFAEAGGNAADLKLFINESGLENEAKLQGLLNWISVWEGDNATKFDGISTTIKATFTEDADQLKATEDQIEKMLKSLAATGRLVRIAGIDIDYIDSKGQNVIAASMTTEQSKKMGELYKFIIAKYKELVPDSQRYGLFISNITDNGDTPNGLWNSNYSRKPQYGAFADGLQ